jgi:arylsulfatase A-like enzyme
MPEKLIKTSFAILVFGLIPFFSACSKSPAQKPNLILISLDTLRADHLGFFGYKRLTSPNLDKLAAKAVVFENASSATSWTLPAHVSLFSGLLPSLHGVTQKKGNVISDKTSLLAEILKSNNYRTFGFANGGYVAGHYGFSRGFEEYPRSGPKGIKNESKEVLDIYKAQGGTGVGFKRAREKIEMLDNKEPFFIFVHTYDIHCPYDPPEPYISKFKTDGRIDIDTSKCIPHEDGPKIKREQAWTLSDRYDGNINWVDDTLGKFFDWFYTTEASKNTYVIVVSDHGEEFLEHNYLDHRDSLYKELVHIPIIIMGPGLKPVRLSNPISLVDVMPTALGLLGFAPPKNISGISYAAFLKTGKSDTELPAWRMAELDRGKVLRSAYDDKSNLIIEKHEETGAEIKKEYFSHPEDPDEKENKFNLNDEKVAKRYNELGAEIKKHPGKKTSTKDSEKDEENSPENLEDLKTLGYL